MPHASEQASATCVLNLVIVDLLVEHVDHLLLDLGEKSGSPASFLLLGLLRLELLLRDGLAGSGLSVAGRSRVVPIQVT